MAIFGLLLAAVLLPGVFLAGAASAHATLVSADPADGSRLQRSPATVEITFDEPVGLAPAGYLHVVDASGKSVTIGSAYHPGGDGKKIAANLRSGLPDATYTESYRIISADSHPVAGVVRFVVGNGPLTAAVGGAGGGPTVNHGVSATFDVARWVSYAGLALLGGSWLLLTVWPEGRDERRAAQVLWTGWAASVLGAMAQLLLQGPYGAGFGLGRLFDTTLLDGTLHTDFGQAQCARLVLLGAFALLLGRVLDAAPARQRVDVLAWPLFLGLFATFSLIGHPNTTAPRWLSVPVDMLHLAAMCAWLGGLVMIVLAALPRGERGELIALLPRFSRVAFGSVCLLAATGLYAAWRGVGTVHAIFGSTYGELVLAKIVLFCWLIWLGNFSRSLVQRRVVAVATVAPAAVPAARLHAVASGSSAASRADAESPGAGEPGASAGENPPTPPADHDPAQPRLLRLEQLRRAVLVEIAIALCVLVATSVLVAEPRGKEALAAQHRQPRSGTAQLGGGRTITLTVDPGVHGTVGASVALSPGPQPQSVTITAMLPARQLGPIPLTLAANGADVYTADGVSLPAAGRWIFTIIVSTSQFNAVTTTITVRLY